MSCAWISGKGFKTQGKLVLGRMAGEISLGDRFAIKGKKRSAPWDRLLEFNKGKDRCCYYFLLVLKALIAIMLVATRDSNEDVLLVVPAFRKKRRLKHTEFHEQSIFHRLFWAVLWLQSFCTVFKKLWLATLMTSHMTALSRYHK